MKIAKPFYMTFMLHFLIRFQSRKQEKIQFYIDFIVDDLNVWLVNMRYGQLHVHLLSDFWGIMGDMLLKFTNVLLPIVVKRKVVLS